MILEKISERTRLRIAECKEKIPLEQVIKQALEMEKGNDFPFEKALEGEEISFICEVKKASPSKGIIAEDFPYLDIAKEYEAAGAAAISVLTEPYFFLGKDEYLKEIAQSTSIPVLRKDFVLDAYQIYEARVLGADAVLLICALLEQDTLEEYITLAHSLGLSALVEAHTEQEVESAILAGARVIGVNNRDLNTFEVELTTSIRLRQMVPSELLFVSESGIKTARDVATLQKHQVNGVLIGETLMRSKDKKRALDILRGEESYED